MHEFSIVRSLLDRIDAEARARDAQAVHRIRIRIGELSGVEPALLASAYAIVRERTACRDAELVIQPVAARWVCPRCDRSIEVGRPLQCVRCGVPARLAGGDEIVLDEIDMEVADV